MLDDGLNGFRLVKFNDITLTDYVAPQIHGMECRLQTMRSRVIGAPHFAEECPWSLTVKITCLLTQDFVCFKRVKMCVVPIQFVGVSI